MFLRFFTIILLLTSHLPTLNAAEIVLGAQRTDLYLPMLKGKRVGLVVNQTSVVNGQHLVDFLVQNNVDVKTIFAPEHGFRGDHHDGQHVSNSKDSKTGINIVSIYGKNKKPSKAMLEEIDVIIFDIQDVGLRFYTYISSMHYVMEAAAEHGKSVIIFDRPNPNGGYIDGPVLDLAFQSFVGMHQIPVLHGLTVGELARMIVGENWLTTQKDLHFTVVAMQNYQHELPYSLEIPPSPNLPNDQAIALYPSLCLFEATPISIGRGTDFPFQVIGHNKVHLGEFSFTPRSIKGASMYPKFKGVKVTGQDLRKKDIQGFDLSYLFAWHAAFKAQDETFFERADFFDKLAGTDALRKAMTAGKSEQQVRASWQKDLNTYKAMRSKYTLYP